MLSHLLRLLALPFLLAAADATAATPPAISSTLPAAGAQVESLTVAEVFFTAPVLGVQAADLLIQNVPASGVSEVAPGHFVFTFNPPPPGDIELRWRANQGIADAQNPSLLFGGGSWIVHLDPTLAHRLVVISEFMADDDLTLYDDDCDRSDWIEIHNGASLPVNLLGWSLTDDPIDLGKWHFPAYTLEPNAYLVVFASQKNKTNLPPRSCRTRSPSLAGFHTNFRLNPDGEYLALADPDGKVSSEFAPSYPPQRRDVSYGRDPASPDILGYFTKPTPRAPNTTTGSGFAAPVQFSRPGMPFVDPFSVRLFCNDTNAIIRYTTDGSFPSETNPNLRTYSTPILIATTTQVRARAYLPGVLPGPPASETYLMLSNDPAHLASFTSSLPVLVITTLRSLSISSTLNTPVHFSLFEPRDGRTTLLSRPTLSTRGGLKTRGSSTAGQPQSPFAAEWWDEFNEDQDLSVLGMPADSEWVLYAPNEFDAGLIHNSFTMGLSRQMNFTAPRTRFVEVYLNKGGIVRSTDWFGLYVLMEKPGLSKGRVDAPKAAPEDVAEPEVTGSYLFKTDRLDPSDTGFSAGGTANCYVEPKEREMKSPQRAPQLAYLTKYFRDLDTALRSGNPTLHDPVRGYPAFIEVTNWMDYHILETLSGQADAIRLSSYFYKRREGKLEYGPRWDYDRAWESKGDGRDDNPRVWDTGGGLFGAPWWNRVLADRDAWQIWIDRWQTHRGGALSQSNMFAYIDSLTNQVSFIQTRQAKKWNATTPRVSYRNEIGIMKTWISNRLAWIDGQIAQPPLPVAIPDASGTRALQLYLRIPAGISSLPNVAIYYTLDGTDPRPPGGTSPPVSFRYSQPILIKTNTRVIARLRDTGRVQRGTPTTTTWSGPVVGTYVVTPPRLVPTELMFEPGPPPAGSPYSATDFEFLEVLNASDKAINLDGFLFTAGPVFRFATSTPLRTLAAGERMLLVANRAAFLTRYPGLDSRIAGEYSASLLANGGHVALVGPAGETAFDFTFSTQWQRLAGGLGFSLVPVNETASAESLGDASCWRLSSSVDGSPGQSDPPPPPSPPHVVINEILTAPQAGAEDWIELYNPDARDADVGGWWLTDSLSSPGKFQIGKGTTIPAGGFLVIQGAAFHPAPHSGFGLSLYGDEVWLLSADPAGNLTGWHHGFKYGPGLTSVTFGRMLGAGGSEYFQMMSAQTPGLPNASPQIGPVIVSEIAPTRSHTGIELGVRDTFIELWNISQSPVPLFDPSSPDRTWHLRGDLDFDMPTGIVLPPDSGVVLVAFDPIFDPYELAGFRARHSIRDSVTILGPWQGDIPTSAQLHVRLLQPDPGFASDTNRTQRLVVEDITVDPGAAPRPGYSLTRRNLATTASDPANWAPNFPTPGESDLDTDGLPDGWENAHGLRGISSVAGYGPNADPDRDGFSNLAELRNGTHPQNQKEALRLRFFRSGYGRWTGMFDATPGGKFLLESLVSPDFGLWEILTTLTVPEEGTVMFSFDTRSATSRLLRVRQP